MGAIGVQQFIDMAEVQGKLVDAQHLAINCDIRPAIDMLVRAERMYLHWAMGDTSNPRIPTEVDDAHFYDLHESTLDYIVRAFAEKCGCRPRGAPEVKVRGALKLEG